MTGGQKETVGGTHPAPAARQGPQVIQDVKYLPEHVLPGVIPRPELQKWKLSPAASPIANPNLYHVSSQAYPNLVLQPADPSQPASPVILGPASGIVATGPINRPQETWQVTSLLLSDQPTTKL